MGMQQEGVMGQPRARMAAAPFWSTTTRALVGAVILGLAFVLVQQVSQRIDALLWPPLIIIGGITWATFTGLITLIYRQPAGFIMGETQALIAVGTGLSPVAIFFIPANGLGSLAYSLVAWKLPMTSWSHHFLAQLATNVVGNVCVAIGLLTTLKLPLSVVIVSSTVTAAAGTVGATILTKRLSESIRRAGLV
jgi:hypothetical protein